MRPKTSTTVLPKALRDQIEASDSAKTKKQRGRKQPLDRKARRKLERQNKRVSTHQSRANHHFDIENRDDDKIESQSGLVPAQAQEKLKATARPSLKNKPLKTLLEDDSEVRPKIRKAVRDQLDEDDAQIARLESKLKIKGKKLPKSFEEDGLDFLLGDIDEGSDSEDGLSYKQYLASKRGKKRKRDVDDAESHPAEILKTYDESQASEEDEAENDSDILVDSQNGLDSENDVFSAVEDDLYDTDSGEPQQELKHPVPNAVGSSRTQDTKITTYIPPSLRKFAAADDEPLAILRRKIQGQLNRLSEANMIQIVNALEDLYRNNPRQQVTSSITDLLLASIKDKAVLLDTFVILHGGLIAALFRVVGVDFAAHIVQAVAQDFDSLYASTERNATMSDAANENGKKANNLLVLLLELYNFGVISSVLIFDLIRIFVKDMNELNTELLLKVVRTSGVQLRQDDPAALKDMVTMMQPAIAQAGMRNLSTKTQFMIETLTNLRNNKSKSNNDRSVVASEATVRMKKTLGTLNSRHIRAAESLRVSLQDIRDIDSKGKWWLIGASWKESDMHSINEVQDHPEKPSNASEDGDDFPDLMQLAREQRMNTDVRKAVFVSIMSAEDFKDASNRLQKLRLKKSQEREIPQVLLHCCGSEHVFNPYYYLIAREQCTRHSTMMTFQFCLWELFRKMGEVDEMSVPDLLQDEDIEEQIPMRKLVNLGKFFGHLVADGSLSLTILKTLKFTNLQSRTKTFLEVFFITIFTTPQKQSQKTGKKERKRIEGIFASFKDMGVQAVGLSSFLKRTVKNTDLANGKEEVELVKWSCSVAEDVLRSIALNNLE